MVDRLDELDRGEPKTKRRRPPPREDDDNGGGGGAGANSLEQELQPITEKLQELQSISNELEELQNKYLEDNSKRTYKDIEKHVQQINVIAVDVKGLLTRFSDETTRLAAKGASNTTIRMRKNQFTMLSRRLIDVTKNVWEKENQHQDDVKGQVARRLQIRYTKPDGTTLPDDEAKNMATKLVENNRQDQVFTAALDELERVMRLKDEVLQLEREMLVLHQMFCDLAVLIDDQGCGVEQVDHTVKEAHRNIEAGEADLKLARKYQGKCCAVS